ncbi:Acyl-CoA synthetase family member 4 [Blattella germanica]|nr:Acyl-CoA synthetase family member 4 [Blattella germanica]
MAVVENENTASLYELFKIAAINNPSRTAICFKTELKTTSVSYTEVLTECQKVSQILHNLDVKCGYVGIHLEESQCLPSILLGILQAELAFVSLDVEDINWDSQIVNYLNIEWVFSTSKTQNQNWYLCTEINVHNQLITLWKIKSVKKSLKDSNKCELSMAYAIQTSGTTGEPKIVQVPHQCIVPNIQHLQILLSIAADDVIFLAAPLTFDPSIIEIFLALSSGAILLIVPRHVKHSPSILLKVLDNEGVTILEATPSFMMRWSKEEIRNSLLCANSSLRVMLLGGEACPPIKVLKQWKAEGNQTKIFNIYGITEVSCWASIHQILFKDENKEENISLGDPLSLTNFKVKNESGDDILIGEGELFIGSKKRICLIDDESMDELCPPVYRATGDIVKIDSESNQIFHIGRRNRIFKRFGHRVSLTLIEKIMANHSSVEQTCCVWEESTKKLGLFLKLREKYADEQKFCKEIRQSLLKQLHPSHIPDLITVIETLPLTCHGKVNYHRLKCLLMERENGPRRNHEHDLIQCFSSLWSHHLCLESVPGNDENFLQNGGNSFLALQIVSELEEIFSSVSTSLIGMLLGGSTFGECCDYLSTKQSTEDLSKSEKLAIVSVPNFELHENLSKRKHLGPINITFNSKNMRLDDRIQSVSTEGNVLFSLCRGKSEIGNITEASGCDISDEVNIQLKWKKTLHKCVDASPRFVLYENGNMKICIGSHSGKVLIIDAGNENSVVECNLPDRIESSVCVSPCGKIGIVGCYDGYVRGIDLSSGIVIWSFHTGGMVKSSPSLCLNASAVVFGSYDHLLYCVKVIDGSLVWSTKIGDGSIYTSPCVSVKNCMIYTAALDGTCAALSEDVGQILWKCKFGSPLFASPEIVQNEDIVIFAEVSGQIHFIAASTGKELCKFQTGGNIFSSFCIHTLTNGTNAVIFGCHDRNVYCLHQLENSVKLKWKCELDSAVFATPWVFPIKYSGTESSCYGVVVASTKGIVYVLDLESGLVKCTHQLPGEVFSSPVVFKNSKKQKNAAPILMLAHVYKATKSVSLEDVHIKLQAGKYLNEVWIAF